MQPGDSPTNSRITKIYRFVDTHKVETQEAILGDIVAIAGTDDVVVGDTYTDPNTPIPLPAPSVDPPTLSMCFIPNNSPFAGTEGDFVTSTHLGERLQRETLSDVALRVEDLPNGTGYRVSGRGELHLSILMERMRREGYEFQVGAPEVITKREGGQLLEPFESLTIDVAEEHLGIVFEKLGARKAQLVDMHQADGMAKLHYKIPTRGLLGYRSEFMSDTRGMGQMNYMFCDYDNYAGDIRRRRNGVLVAMDTCTTVAYALFNLQNRGKLFLGPGVKVYKGQIIGEHCRENDLTVNPAKGKQLTNVRAAGSDENVVLTPPTRMSLEECIAYIGENEWVEFTPKNIRMRKANADKSARGTSNG
jgi:GTP-binding protein